MQDAQNNPWQPNLVYRGYVASPLQGQAQGLAVYVDGARFNQPFGDTVNFDLIPDAAIAGVTLRDASPVYGLNALGGALVIETATGRSVQGIEGAAAIGSYGELDYSLTAGDVVGRFSYFGAVQYREEDGWRDFSPSDLVNGFVDLGYDGVRAGAHFKFIGADTDLTGNGVASVELMAARRQSVFTWPDNTRNRYGRLSLHPWFAIADGLRFEATLYRQRRKAATLNGDAADIEECEEDGLEGLLCLETVGTDDDDEEQAVLTDADGNPIPDILDGGDYGVFNRGNIRTRSEGILAQIVSEHDLGGRTNQLAVGFSYDSSESDFSTSTEIGVLTDERSVEGLGMFIVQPDGAIAPVGLETRTRFWSAFLSDTLPLGETLTAEIGLRYNHANVRLIDQLGTALNGDHSFSRLNPGIELDWAVSPDVTLRVGYSEIQPSAHSGGIVLRKRERAMQLDQLLHRRSAAGTSGGKELRTRRIGQPSTRIVGLRLAVVGLSNDQHQRYPICRLRHPGSRLLPEYRPNSQAGPRSNGEGAKRRIATLGELRLHRCNLSCSDHAQQSSQPGG